MAEASGFEVVVVGAGPAGLAAASAAAESGRRVALVDDNAAPGGQIWRAERSDPHPQTWPYTEALRAPNVCVMPRTTVFDAPRPGVLAAEGEAGALELRYESLILATGARELFLPFPGWTLPGVLGVGGIQAMVKAGLEVRGKRIVVAGSGPLLVAVAASLAERGAQVQVVAEQAPVRRLAGFGLSLLAHPRKLRQGLGYRKAMNAPYKAGVWAVRALGERRVEAVELSSGQKVPCDFLSCAYGLVPNTELPGLLGCDLQDGYVRVDEGGRTSVENVFCAGEPTSIGGVDLSVVEGSVAGYEATSQSRKAQALSGERRRQIRFARALEKAFALREELRSLAAPDTVVCRCEDVRRDALDPAAGWRAAKLQTRCGMGPCQGRVCGAATRFLFGWTSDSVRPPIFPTSVGSLAGSRPADSSTPTHEDNNLCNGAASFRHSPPNSTTTSPSTTPSSADTASG